MKVRRQSDKGVDAGRGDSALKRACPRRSRVRSLSAAGLLLLLAALLALPCRRKRRQSRPSPMTGPCFPPGSAPAISSGSSSSPPNRNATSATIGDYNMQGGQLWQPTSAYSSGFTVVGTASVDARDNTDHLHPPCPSMAQRPPGGGRPAPGTRSAIARTRTNSAPMGPIPSVGTGRPRRHGGVHGVEFTGSQRCPRRPARVLRLRPRPHRQQLQNRPGQRTPNVRALGGLPATVVPGVPTDLTATAAGRRSNCPGPLPPPYSHTGLNTRFYRVSAITVLQRRRRHHRGDHVLVSNTRNVDVITIVSIGDQDKTHSQGFDTGSNPYSLASVGVYVHNEALNSGETFTVHIYTANGSGGPDALVHTLVSGQLHGQCRGSTRTASHVVERAGPRRVGYRERPVSTVL